MSLIGHFGGYVIGVLGKDNLHKAWALSYGRRVNATVPPEFDQNGWGYKLLKEQIANRAEVMKRQMDASGGPVPSH